MNHPFIDESRVSCCPAAGLDFEMHVAGQGSKDFLSKTTTRIVAPTNHAGHHTIQNITWVYVPFTCQAKLACTNSSWIPRPEKRVGLSPFQSIAPINSTTGGDKRTRMRRYKTFEMIHCLVPDGLAGNSVVKIAWSRATNKWMKDKGQARMPVKNPREKFKVDKVARNIPRNSSEKQFSSTKP